MIQSKKKRLKYKKIKKKFEKQIENKFIKIICGLIFLEKMLTQKMLKIKNKTKQNKIFKPNMRSLLESEILSNLQGVH